MKEVVEKDKCIINLLLKHLILSHRNIFAQKIIINNFNECFLNVGPKLACEIHQSQRSSEMTLKPF